MELTELTLVETVSGLDKKQFSLLELNHSYLARIQELNPKLNAFLTVNEECNGIPAAVKDVIVTRGIKTTAGSAILENFIAPYDATVAGRLAENGVGVIGKANCDEFAMGSSGENSAYGLTKNPWDLSRVPGGSSSGSAAAVAADLCVFALGTDTGGSIRQPASLCGVVGLKPSYGRVSRWGLIAMASSLDCPGPITKTVGDARLVLSWISGKDGLDSNCQVESFQSKSKKTDLKGVRAGVPRKEYFGEGLDSGVRATVEKAMGVLEKLGAEIVEVGLPHTEYAIATYYVVMASEASSNLARYEGIRFGETRDKFGAEAKRRIMLGTFSLSVGYFDDYFAKAARVRTLICQDFAKAFEKCDVLVGPVSPTVAWKLGEKVDDPLKMYLSDVYTIPASLAGLPGLSIPCGFVDSLPVGLQILGKHFDEETVLRVGASFEQVTAWHKERPKL